MTNLQIAHPAYSDILLIVCIADQSVKVFAETDDYCQQVDICQNTAEYALQVAIDKGHLGMVDWKSLTRDGWVEMGNQYSNCGYWEIKLV